MDQDDAMPVTKKGEYQAKAAGLNLTDAEIAVLEELMSRRWAEHVLRRLFRARLGDTLTGLEGRLARMEA